MSEDPTAGTPHPPRDASWPQAAPQPPQQAAQPAPPVTPTYPTYPTQGYQQPPTQGYQAPQQGYQQPYNPQLQSGSPQAAASSVQLNYWLSVFFSWIPALIFYVTEKGKNQLADEYHRANLNFALVRVIASVGIAIPYLGILFGIAAVVLFVFHIMAAASAQENFKRGLAPKFAFNLDMIKA